MRKYLTGLATTSLLSLTVLAATTVGAAAASVLPDAFSSVSCSFGGQTATDATSCSLGFATANGQGHAAASVDFGVPSITDGANAIPVSPSGQYYSGSATASLTYYFQVLGAVDGTPVPIIIMTNLNAGPIHVPGVSGTAGITAAGVGKGTCSGTQLCLTPQFHGNLSTVVNTGEVQQVNLSLFTSAQGPLPVSGGGYADAAIFIDPSFADAGNYSLQFSTGIGPVVGVPEPASWALLLIGFGAVGCGMRRSRVRRLSLVLRP